MAPFKGVISFMVKRKRRRGRRRRGGFLDVVNALLTLLVVGVLVIGGLALYGIHGFYSPGPISKATTFVVDKGANIGAVAAKLDHLGLIENPYIFQLGGWVLKERRDIKAGEFAIGANASMADILHAITSGKPILHSITIPEGFTVAQVIDRLNNDPRLTGKITKVPAEGSVLPQTYNYDPGVSRQSVLDKMVAAEQKALAKVWANRAPNLPYANPEQLVTLASMVEKETGVADERAHVASVFINRLVKHMRLQSDPTVIYGITKGVPLGRGLKRSEIEGVTPYNTYQVYGLPPGPIANPGLQALEAAAHPDNTKDLYFVAESADPHDGHLFSATYAAHLRNVAKFRTAKQQADEADAEAAKAAIEQSQAEAAGDNSVSQPVPAAPAPAPTPESARESTPAPAPAEATAPAATEIAPIPMPAGARPSAAQ